MNWICKIDNKFIYQKIFELIWPFKSIAKRHLPNMSSAANAKTFVERHFTKYYRIIINEANSEICLNQYAFLHFNKLQTLDCWYQHLKTFHDRLSKGAWDNQTTEKNRENIIWLSFQRKTTRCTRKKEKLKKCNECVLLKLIIYLEGAFKVYPDSPICKVTYAEGEEFTLTSNVEGRVIEINERIIEDPSILLKFVNWISYEQVNNLWD